MKILVSGMISVLRATRNSDSALQGATAITTRGLLSLFGTQNIAWTLQAGTTTFVSVALGNDSCTWLRTSSLNNELENSVGSNPTNRQMAPVDLILLSSMIGSLRLQVCKLKSGCSPKTQGFGRVWAPQLSNSCSSASWLGDSKYAEFFREFS